MHQLKVEEVYPAINTPFSWMKIPGSMCGRSLIWVSNHAIICYLSKCKKIMEKG